MIVSGAGLLLVLSAGFAAWLLESRDRLADGAFRSGIVIGSFAALWPAVSLLAGFEAPAPPVGAWYGLDQLSAWFLVIVLGVGAVTAVYGVPYLAAQRGHRRVGQAHFLLAVLLVALAGVVTARTVVAFLVAWEVMAVSAWLLVIFEHHEAEVRRAGFIYLVLTHTSTVALFGMFAAWTGGAVAASFADLAAASGSAPAGLILILGLVGFGIKAGMVPVHFWLPGAHAAAPSHISALLSGVMLKTGIYGLLRVLMLLGTPPAWWGWTVLLLGLTSAVLGVLWALGQHDLKRLLAYHSVENIGIILLGVGLGALGAAHNQPALALLGLAGALLHSLNHALFKSLLFLGAGAVIRAAGTREIDRLGGLARVVPRTASAFLIGSLAIVGLPPLNGFVSEWLVFLGLLQAGTGSGALRAASAFTAGLALTGALALACFTKLHGTVFLGTRRQPQSTGGESDAGLVAPQWVLAGACIVIGVLPGLFVPIAARVAGIVMDGGGGSPAAIEVVAAAAPDRITLLALVLAGVTGVVWLLRRHRTAGRSVESETWACAYPRVTSRMQYSASSYAASLLAAFGPLSGTHVLQRAGSLEVHGPDPVIDRMGSPLWARVQRAAFALRVIQTGRLRWYLLYLICSLLALLVYLWATT